MARTPGFMLLRRLVRQAATPDREPSARPAASSTTRRQLLRDAALASALATTAGLGSGSVVARASTPSIAIVGAGLAGLTAAWHLKQRGITTTVYEAGTRVGGRCGSTSNAFNAGFVVDFGGSFLNLNHADMLGYVQTFGLTLVDQYQAVAGLPYAEATYWFNGRYHPESELADDLRGICAQIATDAKKLDRNYDRWAPVYDAMSVKDYFDQYAGLFGAAYARSLLEDTIRTEYGVKPNRSSLLQLLSNLPAVTGNEVDLYSANDETYFVREGTGRIPQALGADLGTAVKLGHRLTRIGGTPGNYTLDFATATGTTTVNAGVVVLATAFTALRDATLDLALPARLTDFITTSELGTNEKVFCQFASRPWRRPGGFSREIWGDFPFPNVWDDTLRAPPRPDGILTYYTGAESSDPVLTASTAAAVGTSFTQALDTALPGLAAAATGQYLKTGWRNNPLFKGAYSSFRPGELTKWANWFWVEGRRRAKQEVYVDNLYFVGEHLSDEYYGYMNGAAQTGRLAAASIAKRFA
ncbi:MAG: NAD(P)/FAD-dependent oxidoreductase [Geminicoccaceae bacterium]